MSSRKTKLVAVAASALAAAGIAGGALASSASAATTNYHKPAPHACAYNLNGGNVLDLTFQGNTYTYPVVLHVANDGLITGFLLDKGLPAGQQYLRVNGVCNDGNVVLDSNYPTADPQGSRSEDMVATPIAGHHRWATVAGVWDETGTEAGSGAASLQYPVHRF